MSSHSLRVSLLVPLVLLALEGCEPIRLEIFHPSSTETLDPGTEQPDAGTSQTDAGPVPPDAGTGRTDAGTLLLGTAPFCFEARKLGESMVFTWDSQGVGNAAYVQGYRPYFATTRPGDVPEPVSLLNTSHVSDLEVDAQDHRHLVFYADLHGYLAYLHDREGTWQTVTLDTASAYNVDLEIEPSGSAHVLFDTRDAPGVQYASNHSGSWVTETIYISVFRGRPILAVDAWGHAHVAFNAVPGEGIHYTTNVSGTWLEEQVAVTGGGQPALELDVLGRPHLLYRDADGRYVHATKEANHWKYSVVAPGEGAAASLLVDPGGTVHALFDTNRASLAYANNTGGTWHVMPLFTLATHAPGDNLTWTSFKLDSEGKPVIGFEYDVLDDSHGYGSRLFYFAQPRPCP